MEWHAGQGTSSLRGMQTPGDRESGTGGPPPLFGRGQRRLAAGGRSLPSPSPGSVDKKGTLWGPHSTSWISKTQVQGETPLSLTWDPPDCSLQPPSHVSARDTPLHCPQHSLQAEVFSLLRHGRQGTSTESEREVTLWRLLRLDLACVWILLALHRI